MIGLPTKGIDQSLRFHKCNKQVLCDWLEACICFDDDRISIADVCDELIAHEIYEDQDFAKIFINECWDEMELRAKAYQNEAPYRVDSSTLNRIAAWDEKAGHAFCLLISLSPYYDWWKEESYNEQGLLFELLTSQSVEQTLSCKTYPTGWSRENTKQFEDHAKEICNILNFSVGKLEKWSGRNKKEYGLDILAYIDFEDERTGIPYYMIQCASGNNWKTKVHAPEVNIWREVLNPSVLPCKGFSMPFCVDAKEFECECTRISGVFLDRTRLLYASRWDEGWVGSELKTRIKAWCDIRIDWLRNGHK